MQPRATRDDYDRALEGIEYPASTDLILRTARDHGGIDSEVASMLERLPERTFVSREELNEAIRALYSSVGVEEARIPL